jgi:signal transduction histidine kinase
LGARNLDSLKLDNGDYVRKQLNKMKREHKPIVIDLGNDIKQYYYYRNSILLTKLTYYPYIQLAVILLFILVSYFAFSEARKAEQNLVWVGLSKETAHQLGTPTSSLLAWVELLKQKSDDKQLIRELHKDVTRLEKITERFSKIGSKPTLRKENIIGILRESVEYLKTRTSENIRFNIEYPYDDIKIPVNTALFEWVVENVCKNAIDAMNGNGTVNINVVDNTQIIYIDISDAGKGISKGKFKTIFKPGFTSKQRGWGLGLSVAKRIIEDYHDGKIFVYQSEPARGTTIRIVLKK